MDGKRLPRAGVHGFVSWFLSFVGKTQAAALPCCLSPVSCKSLPASGLLNT